MEEKLLKCPNCGANATNHQNCEYCGSLLVRFVDKGIDLSKTTYMSNDGVIPGLIEHLKKNLEWQTENQGKFVSTQIACENEDIPWIEVGNVNGKKDLSISLQIDEEYEYWDAFKNLKSFPLFTCIKNDGDSIDEYYICFGKDVEGAARLISELAYKVFEYPQTETSINTDLQTGPSNVDPIIRKYTIGPNGIGVESVPENSNNNNGGSEEDGIPGWVWYVAACILIGLIKACS